MEEDLIIYSDGGSRGNPGPAALGFLIQNQSGGTLFKEGRFIGITTNNTAEYQAVTAALTKALQFKSREVVCYLDSELVVKQLNGQYRVKNPRIIVYYNNLKKIISLFSKVQFKHIPREKNHEADRLVNQTLDDHGHSN